MSVCKSFKTAVSYLEIHRFNEMINGCTPFRWLISLTWDTLVEAIFDVIVTPVLSGREKGQQVALVRLLLGKM